MKELLGDNQPQNQGNAETVQQSLYIDIQAENTLKEAQAHLRGAIINGKLLDEYEHTGVTAKNFGFPSDIVTVSIRPHLYTEVGKTKKYKNKTIYYGKDDVLTGAWLFKASQGITARHLPVEIGEALDAQGIPFKKTLSYRVRKIAGNVVKRIIQ